MNIVKGKTADWEVIIGLESHAQITSEYKLFSNSIAKFGGEPNSHVSFIDAAMPGMLPVLNESCVMQAVRTGLGLNAVINKKSFFDRKNYFYPDLPQGYQISQFSDPIIGHGYVNITLNDGRIKTINITRIHLEQDAGKSLHDQSANETFIDLNRSGIPLLEIVTEPDMRSGEEAACFLKKLRSILRYLGTCDGDMEKGSLRCDANVSVRKINTSEYGTRVEIKNLNSIKYVIKAIQFEAERQVQLLENGASVIQETRVFDVHSGQTKSMRSKEDAVDYRYFRDPDLPPIILSDAYIEAAKQNLPELPDDKVRRYVEMMKISEYDANSIVVDKVTAHYFEQVAAFTEPKQAANWILVELFGKLNKVGISIEDSPVKPEQLAELLMLMNRNVISGKLAKQVFEQMFATGKSAAYIVEKQGLVQITDVSTIETFVSQVITRYRDKVIEYQNGSGKLFGFFVGQVMQLSQGKANPKVVNCVLREYLSK